jgi:glycosyltransferase involved in cell wall biosynthesis
VLSRKKVAITLNTAWNIYNFRLGLMKKLRDKGYEVIAIAPEDDFVTKIEEEGFKFIPIKNLSRKGTNPINDFKLALELHRIYKREKVDLVLQYTIKPVIYGILAAKFANVKSINTLTGLGYSFLSSGLVNHFVKRLYKLSLQYATKVWFQNKDDKELFVREKLVKSGNIDIINGSGINTTYFRPSDIFKENSPLIFLFIGRLLFDKGIQEFVKAARIVKEQGIKAEFHVVGALDTDNPSAIDKSTLDSWIKEKAIYYHGTTNDVRAFIQKSDIIVLPSYREGLPRVMLEGMSMGKPLITTDVPGCRETVVNNYNGFLVEVKNETALANVFKEMLTLGSSVREKMGIAGRKMALEIFDEKIITQKYINAVNEELL